MNESPTVEPPRRILILDRSLDTFEGSPNGPFGKRVPETNEVIIVLDEGTVRRFPITLDTRDDILLEPELLNRWKALFYVVPPIPGDDYRHSKGQTAVNEIQMCQLSLFLEELEGLTAGDIGTFIHHGHVDIKEIYLVGYPHPLNWSDENLDPPWPQPALHLPNRVLRRLLMSLRSIGVPITRNFNDLPEGWDWPQHVHYFMQKVLRVSDQQILINHARQIDDLLAAWVQGVSTLAESN